MTEEQEKEMLEQAKQYHAEDFLQQAVDLLKVKKKLDISIVECEWFIGGKKRELALKVDFKVEGHYVLVNILETVFKDYYRQYDEKIGIKSEMPMKTKILLRIAYLLFAHRNDD